MKFHVIRESEKYGDFKATVCSGTFPNAVFVAGGGGRREAGAGRDLATRKEVGMRAERGPPGARNLLGIVVLVHGHEGSWEL